MRRELTKRELDVLRLSGYSCKEIAAKLCISLGTAKDHLHNIKKKLKVATKEQSLIVALKYHLLGIKEVDCGFWDSNDIYIEDIQPVDLRKE